VRRRSEGLIDHVLVVGRNLYDFTDVSPVPGPDPPYNREMAAVIATLERVIIVIVYNLEMRVDDYADVLVNDQGLASYGNVGVEHALVLEKMTVRRNLGLCYEIDSSGQEVAMQMYELRPVCYRPDGSLKGPPHPFAVIPVLL